MPGKEPALEGVNYRSASWDDVKPHLWNFFQAVRTRKPVVEDVVFAITRRWLPHGKPIVLPQDCRDLGRGLEDDQELRAAVGPRASDLRRPNLGWAEVERVMADDVLG